MGVVAMLDVSCAAAIDQIDEDRKNREIEDAVDPDRDSQKPTKGPSE